jgi:hypothetical protein
MRALSVLLVIPATVYAWGSVGHTLTGQLAQKLMKPETASKLAKILPTSFNGDVGRATTWADEVKRSKGYAGWSGPLHYSDAEDSPPTACSYDYKRDCPDGNCVVGAIANYTQRLGCRNSQAVREEAAKFLTHFLGDITQPLHLCGRDKGGNEAKVKFDRKSSNLHSIWDTNMLEKKMKANFGGSQPRYLDYLLKMATTTREASKWSSCLLKSGNVALNCPVEWASDSDEMNCSAVWPAYEEDASQNFGEAYYTANIDVAERQVVKAGVRMAAWFDKYLSESCTSTSRRPSAGGKVGWLNQ